MCLKFENLKKEAVTTLAIEQECHFSAEFRSRENKKYALVLEMKFTVFQEVALCDGCIEIPQLGTKHSLNISVSAGSCLGFISKNKLA
jgi:tRNA G18 (ribose-2'-O)-methylase SpoU